MTKASFYILVGSLLAGLGAAAYILFFFNPQVPNASQRAVSKAKQIYQQKKEAGGDFRNGPCLSNNLMPDWVADIAHNPRQPIDDQSENQCLAYVNGTAHHFVELDPEGNVIRTY